MSVIIIRVELPEDKRRVMAGLRARGEGYTQRELREYLQRVADEAVEDLIADTEVSDPRRDYGDHRDRRGHPRGCRCEDCWDD